MKPVVNLTDKRHEGIPCVKCGGTVRFKSNRACVACIKGYIKDNDVHTKMWAKNKLACMAAYGGKCAICGEKDIDVLTLDHVDGSGSKHRIADPDAMLYRVRPAIRGD